MSKAICLLLALALLLQGTWAGETCLVALPWIEEEAKPQPSPQPAGTTVARKQAGALAIRPRPVQQQRKRRLQQKGAQLPT